MIKRFCELNGIEEVSDLKAGMDFRLPQYRREVFLRFYEFHLKYKAHAGAVYYVFPALFNTFNLSVEQKFWFCFLNGYSQHVLTTWELFQKFPDFDKLDLSALSKYFRANYKKFGWDTDRRYHKNTLEQGIECYRNLIKPFGTQFNFFTSICKGESYCKNFDSLWSVVLDEFFSFGRLATFSYLEYLKIAGLNIDCSNLFFEDVSGSKSHRNGICKVLGRDDKDWHDKLNPSFDGKYSQSDFRSLTDEAEMLLSEARSRFNHPDLSYFTLETTLCCYKSWHRPNRRYPNVYNDMFADRIRKHEKSWNKSANLFWKIRADNLPENLRIENNPFDVGLNPIKQNHYLETGQVIMMDKDWSCFKNDYNDFIDRQQGVKDNVSR